MKLDSPRTAEMVESEVANDAMIHTTMTPSEKSHVPSPQTSSEADADEPGDVEKVASSPPSDSQPAYTILSKRMKIMVTITSSVGALISPLSSTIYLPALNQLSQEYGVTTSQINLTLTTYTVMQAVAPSLYSDFADSNGYRPAIIVSYIIYIGANIALALQSSYGALLGLRVVQALGASATISLCMGILSAVVTPAERGTYMAYARAGLMFSPACGPVLGGVLAQFAGWRSIFWFLTALSGAYLVPYAILVPETNRRIVGNGSLPAKSLINKSGLDILKSARATKAAQQEHQQEVPIANAPSKRSWQLPRPWRSLTIMLNKDVFLVIYFISILVAAFYAGLATLPALFGSIYHYNDLQIGLCYIPSGVGATLGSIVNGKLQDRNFKRVAQKHNIPYDKRKDMDLRNFPIEQCRIVPTYPSLLVACLVMITYGFGLQYGAPVGVALVQQFIVSTFLTSSMNSIMTLLIDFFPQQAATVTASSNLFRCLFTAGIAAFVNPLIEAIGLGWAFFFIAGVLLIHLPLLPFIVKKGPKWREERRLKQECEQQEKEGSKPKEPATESL